MEGVIAESGSLEHNGDVAVDSLFEERPGDVEGTETELVVIKDGDTEDGLDGDLSTIAKIKRQTYVE
jgi:hypothetical protein